MIKLRYLTPALGLALILSPSLLSAAAATGPKAALMAKYDVNKNAKLDADEVATIRKDFAANPEDPALKPFDTDNDGQLSKDEISKMTAKGKGKSGSDKKASSKKSQ